MSLEREAKLEMEKTLTRAKFPYLIEITNIKNDNTSEILLYSVAVNIELFFGR